MFNDQLFDQWLDKKASDIVTAFGDGRALTSEEMMILILKAQTNHFNHLDVELRTDMKDLRADMDKRFEQVDKRFEQVDKRFETVIVRIYHFMIWSFATTLAVGASVVAAIKLT
jgi:hypothetical protein